ncbi:phosphatidate cytidylyltransferase [Streptococcus sp. IsoGale021]|uniref:phosphatidate cytidylyltransferase n=1 Tax=Streptococcus TaxID=1301 RepID=UPI0020014916|nr:MULTISPECIES: phosphatidate cytidylyltransferase [Streptococcus]MCY7210003.1 phosphatidate cytidylyltransferase [Streptococcus anginosus]MCY7226847.1 phosphatidate cytidylyltransferase [Streptococcus anginosus]MDQ8694919.1 phosphatidate cytidylyltransferase [Streptococcus sp. IsoGale021]MDU5128983.1 phosphatidate cytidylyltransferase [Streptococcus anginosus]MEE0847853.1 phosphatidate cytidylyltransferase [Streptococcus anginosus]
MDKDLQRRVIFGGVALAIFIPVLMIGGALLQIGMGLLAMLGVHELLQMKGLRSTTLEGVLAMLAGFVLTIPLENYLKFLPIDGNVVAYSLVVFLLLGSTVLGKNYSFEDAAYPIAASFYVGIGFNALLDARVAGFDKVLLALFIVWATDSGAYLIGRRYGVRRLAPHVSPNKTIEGSLGGIASAVLVTFVFMLIDRNVAAPHHMFVMLLFTVFFSIAGQFGDLVESAIKRHFGVKDSGKFIPGHGGVLDRFDSMLFVFPLMHFFGLF